MKSVFTKEAKIGLVTIVSLALLYLGKMKITLKMEQRTTQKQKTNFTRCCKEVPL